jgi:CRISPR-associated endonuclease Cas3-HD
MDNLMEYLAHSSKNGIPPQYYVDHIQNVAALAATFAQTCGAYCKQDKEALVALVEKASWVHDLGKLEKENQIVLSGERKAKRLPNAHWDAGAAFLSEFCQFAAVAVYSHHRGYPDFSAESIRGEHAFRVEEQIGKTDEKLTELIAIHEKLLGLTESTIQDIIPKGDYGVFFRVLLSCLADADHSDTAEHYGNDTGTEPAVELQPAKRLAKLNEHVADLAKKHSKNTTRTHLRSEMYNFCRDTNLADSVGISSCDSPVGSGKTTAVMAHLLTQAQKRGLRRIFIVLPFTNIIQQSVEEYRNALVFSGENPKDVVAELHHRADFESEHARHYTALWRAPIIVTTAVAFFETLAENSPAALRRLHELPGSAIFVDEAHAALPATLLPIAWKWMNIYADEWSCYWVLASGTLCRFWQIAEISQNIKRDIPEIVDEDFRKRLGVFESRRIHYKSDLKSKTIESMIEWINMLPGPRLVIVNTVNNAAVLANAYKRRFGREAVEHLSTALTPDDRGITLNRVKERLENKSDMDWVLVATSCVEAGVNLSFRTGFRELSSLCSLIQTSGRVDREGSDWGSEIWTFTFADATEINRNPSVKDAAEVLRSYLLRNIEISPELCTNAISDEIRLHGISGIYKELLEDEQERGFSTVEKKFKVIENDTRLAVVSSDIAEKVKAGEINWQELQNKSVQIQKYSIEKLRIPAILEDIFLWNQDYDDFLGYMAGILSLNDPSKYIL